jgi:hypothetical protein
MKWNEEFEKGFYTVEQKQQSGQTGSAIETMQNCVYNVFILIKNIQDPSEQEVAANEVVTKTNWMCQILENDLKEREKEYLRRSIEGLNGREISRRAKQFYESKNYGLFCISNIYHSLGEGVFEILGEVKAVSLLEKAILIVDYNTHVNYDKVERKTLKNKYRERINQIQEEAAKRRFEEYWDAHQEEKTILESEKQSLIEKITTLNQEITTTPQNVDGYTHMVELQKKVQNLISERKAFGFFKFKDKWAVQKQINAVNSEITPIHLRIKSAVKEVENLISKNKNTIKEIDHELTKPR